LDEVIERLEPAPAQSDEFASRLRGFGPVGLLAIVVIVAETLFRGFAFERLRRLLANSRRATIAIVVLTSLLFGLVHYPDQGLPGVQQAVVVGIVLGSIFARTGSLVMPMVVHAAFDLTALWIIYWDLEEEIARFIFR
jgi:membrane protease YdiL (CAAX protease family)